MFLQYSVYPMMTNHIRKTRERPRRQRQNAVLNLDDIWGPHVQESDAQIRSSFQLNFNVARCTRASDGEHRRHSNEQFSPVPLGSMNYHRMQRILRTT
jgi:hypothetical protein